MADEQSTAIYDANTTRILADGAEFHPVADIFPAMSDAEFRELVEDIREHGQREPVWILEDGSVIDGKHRVKACVELGRSVEARVYHGEGDAIVDFVLSLNMVRRHLSINQKLAAAHKAIPMYREQAKQRRLATQNNDAGRAVQANLPEQESGQARDHVADVFGVSPRSVESAETVYRDGVPELVQAFESDEVSVSAAAEVATLPEDEQREVVARGEKEILTRAKEIRAAKHKARKQERIERVKAMDWPVGIYRVVYADPPWQYENSGLNQSAQQQYDTMNIDAICELPVEGIAADDAVLFLWATSPLLPEALKVIDAWGFEYKTSFVWDKARPNYGFYNSVQHEFLLLATRGTCTPDIDERIPSVVRIERTERHSTKPAAFRELVDKLYPHGPRVELFAREAADGWVVWGNEVGGNGDV